jgi:hypothetical protein
VKSEFYQDYKDLSVAELVRVAKSPWDYQPEAIRAAERVLRERGISAEEIAAEEWALAQNEMLEAATKKRFSDYFEWIGELFRLDGSKGPAEKWFGLFLLFYGLYYVCSLYQDVRFVVWYYRCVDCREAGPAVCQTVIFQLYFTVTLFLVLKQRFLGWALLCIQAIVLICMKLALCYRFYQHHLTFLHRESYLLAFIVNTAILVFLFRPFILELFRIDQKIRDRVLLEGIGLGLVGMVYCLA